jgi:hypothetical protein
VEAFFVVIDRAHEYLSVQQICLVVISVYFNVYYFSFVNQLYFHMMLDCGNADQSLI